MSIRRLGGGLHYRRRVKTPRREFQHRCHLFPRDVKPVHHLTDSRSRSRLSNTTETGVRVSRNTQAPLRLPGMLSTAGHCDQSRLAMICAPSLRIHCCVTAPGPGDHRMARLKCCCAWVGGSSLREFSPRPYARRSQIDIPPHPSENKSNASEIPAPAHPPMLLSSSNMEHSTDSTPLTTIQQCVVNALAAGSTLTDAAEAYSVHRVTVYRWMKTCQPSSAALIFSLLSYFVAVPSAIKVFNWTATMYRGSITYQTPMLYAFGFIGLFTIGGLTGLFLGCLGIDVPVTDTYFVGAHFHYVMVGGMFVAYLAGMHFWWPKISGRMYPEGWGKLAALIVFIGFNLTFFPQFLLGYMGMPRRYHAYPPEFQILNVLWTAGATILAVGYLLPMVYFLWSMRYGPPAPANPWNAAGLEWMIPSPPPTSNFEEQPVVTWEAYNYDELGEIPQKQEVPVAH